MPGFIAMDGNGFYLLIPMAVAVAASLVLTPLVRHLAWRLRVLAYPDSQRRFHAGPVPLLGGVAVYFALVVGLIAALLLDRFRQSDLVRLCWVLIPTAGMACLFGVIDDCYNLRSRAKLALQFLAALMITSAGFSVDFITVFGCRIELGWWGVPLTICWLMGCINAMNLIDGLDGLASIIGISTTSMLGMIAWNMGNHHVTVAAMAMTFALAGFLVFNRPPASVFLGDSGSTLIGLVVGVLGIQGSLTSSATLSITAPVVLMTLPMFDVLMAVVRRKLTGSPLALGDREHIHHCLLERGLGPWQVVGILGAFCLTTGVAATAATVFHRDALAWIIATALIVLMIRLRVFGHREFGLIHKLVRRHAENLARSIFLQKRKPHMHIRLRNMPSKAASVGQPAQTIASPLPCDLEVGVIYTGERDLMGPLLSTLKASAPGLNYRLILVDNHSTDGIEPWQQNIPETKVLKNSERLHYSANMNRILAASTARYVLLMNTDMFFDPRQQCLSRMVEFMDSHPNCGIAGCRLFHADGHDARAARRFQTLSVILARRFGLGGLMRRTLEHHFYMDHAPDESFDCQWLSGCFLMLRNKAVEKVGLFDESFGKYFEDVDMCLRMARAGWEVMYHGATSAYHIEQRASHKLLSTDAWKHLRSYLYWLNKWGYRTTAEATEEAMAEATSEATAEASHNRLRPQAA